MEKQLPITHYTISEKELSERGYTFQKLFARNHKTYRKEIAGFTVWVWVKNKMVEINEWFHYTGNIVKYFTENVAAHEAYSRSNYMVVMVNRDTCEISLSREVKAKYNISTDNDWYEHEQYDNYREVVLHIPNFKKVIEEFNYLTK
jgi:hypothetical protein